MKITILVENSVYRSGLSAEPGLSIYIEKDTSRVLFDTGQSVLI
jgi:7,8-dihydropterin-6-yl-methyl-4-(beta-D-ribofuranosyl)aminobenzene 5'-phosphate synthase